MNLDRIMIDLEDLKGINRGKIINNGSKYISEFLKSKVVVNNLRVLEENLKVVINNKKVRM